MKTYRLKNGGVSDAVSDIPHPTGLTQKEFDWLTKLGPAVDQHLDELTGFEQTFAEAVLERFRRYGIRTLVSKRQWEIIAGISEKVL
jgi:hypothetical protein